MAGVDLDPSLRVGSRGGSGGSEARSVEAYQVRRREGGGGGGRCGDGAVTGGEESGELTGKVGNGRRGVGKATKRNWFCFVPRFCARQLGKSLSFFFF